MKTSINTRFATVLVATMAAFASVPALACSDHGERYVAPAPAKPIIEIRALSDPQFAELDAYAAALKQQIEAIRTEQSKFDFSNLDEASRLARRNEFDDRVQQAAKRLSDTVSFHTKITVGNGMLCGAQIEVFLPPRPDDIEAGWDGLHVWGKGKSGTRERGLIYIKYLREQLAELRNPTPKKN
jgi:hypothetical protein